MPDRTCANCGAAVGPLGEQCRACGSDPDVRLIELGGGGGRRSERPAPATGGGGRRADWRRWAPIGVAAVAVWAAFAAFAGGGDEGAAPDVTIEERDDLERTTTTRPRQRAVARPVATTTTLPPVVVGAPLLGEPTGLVLGLLGDGASSLVHLDTGQVERLGGPIVAAGPDRVVVADEETDVVMVRSVGFDVPRASLGITMDQREGWVDPERGLWRASYATSPAVELVSWDGVPVVSHVLPAESWPIGVFDGRLAIRAPGGTYLLDADGAERLSTGTAIAASAAWLVVRECDDLLRCEVVAYGADGGEPRPLPEVDGMVQQVEVSSVGQVAWLTYDDRFGGGSVVVEGDLVDVPGGPFQSLVWSPDGRWLVVVTGADRVLVIDADSGRPAAEIDLGDIGIRNVWRVVAMSSTAP